MYLWWSLCILYLYACQWELLQTTQVFVFVLVWLFRALINSLVCWFVAGHWCHWPRQYSVNELDTCLKTILSLRDVGEHGNILQGQTTANVSSKFPESKTSTAGNRNIFLEPKNCHLDRAPEEHSLAVRCVKSDSFQVFGNILQAKGSVKPVASYVPISSSWLIG